MNKIINALKVPFVVISTFVIERTKSVSGESAPLYGPINPSPYADPTNILTSLSVLLVTIVAALVGVYFFIFRKKNNAKKVNKRR